MKKKHFKFVLNGRTIFYAVAVFWMQTPVLYEIHKVVVQAAH